MFHFEVRNAQTSNNWKHGRVCVMCVQNVPTTYTLSSELTNGTLISSLERSLKLERRQNFLINSNVKSKPTFRSRPINLESLQRKHQSRSNNSWSVTINLVRARSVTKVANWLTFRRRVVLTVFDLSFFLSKTTFNQLHLGQAWRLRSDL